VKILTASQDTPSNKKKNRTLVNAEISPELFINMSVFAAKSGFKKKDIVEKALLDFLAKHDKK
jgi:hypothetical protein